MSESEPSSSHPSNSISNSFSEGKKVSTLKEEFLSRLKECPGYPFDEYGDSAYFLYAEEEYPDIDIVKELDKKIAWWKEHPGALKQRRKTPHTQLDDWFSKEQEFQKRRGD